MFHLCPVQNALLTKKMQTSLTRFGALLVVTAMLFGDVSIFFFFVSLSSLYTLSSHLPFSVSLFIFSMLRKTLGNALAFSRVARLLLYLTCTYILARHTHIKSVGPSGGLIVSRRYGGLSTLMMMTYLVLQGICLRRS